MLGGTVLVAGVAWWLYTKGYFDSILGPLTAQIDKLAKPGEKVEEKEKKEEPKITCKDGKKGTQAECNKQAKCKSGEHWDSKSKKCVKDSKLALAYVGTSGPHSAYKLYNVSNVL